MLLRLSSTSIRPPTLNKGFLDKTLSGISLQVHYIPIHLQPFYVQLGFKRNSFVESEKYSEKALSLPIHPSLNDKDLEYIISVIKNFFL